MLISKNFITWENMFCFWQTIKFPKYNYLFFEMPNWCISLCQKCENWKFENLKKKKQNSNILALIGSFIEEFILCKTYQIVCFIWIEFLIVLKRYYHPPKQRSWPADRTAKKLYLPTYATHFSNIILHGYLISALLFSLNLINTI